MHKHIIAIVLMLIPVLGATKITAPLWGTVTGVAEDDVLNVRSRPDHRAPKTGALPPEAVVGVERCKKVGRSTWCRVHHLAQYDYEGFGWDAKPGWVNARFLQGHNRGYVLVDGEPHCDYALSCSQGICDVVIGLEQDSQGRTTELLRRRIPRARLRAASRFDAMGDEEGGYCTVDHMIEDYFKRQKAVTGSPLLLSRQAVQWIHGGDIDALARHVHPKRGVRLSWQTDFRMPRSHTFSRDQLRAAYLSRKKLDWGTDTAKGDPIRMDLKSFFRALTRDPAKISQLQTSDCHGFPHRRYDPIHCIEAKWTNPHSDTRDFDWLGLAVVLEQYQGKWYVVGLLHDRWEI